MNRKALDELKQQIPLLDYLQAHDWQAARRIRGERLMGLCPLHTDHKPSFLVDPHKNLFYCYGCSRGGDVIRFAELYHQVKFSQAVALLREWCGLTPLLDQVTDFYRTQLFRHRPVRPIALLAAAGEQEALACFVLRKSSWSPAASRNGATDRTAVGLGLWITRVRNARLQMTAWTLVLVAALVMPFLMRWPTIELRPPHKVTATAPLVIRAVRAGIPHSALSTGQAARHTNWRAIAISIHSGVAVVFLLRLLTGVWLTLMLWRRSRRVHEAWTGTLDIRETSAINAPVTFGSTILLPPEWRDWDDRKLRAVIEHERAHVEWGDFYVQLIGRLHVVVFWFSPLAWWLQNRLILLAEAASDDAVLQTVGDRSFYAGVLLGLVGNVEHASAAVAMARPATISRRVERILSRTGLPTSAGWKLHVQLTAAVLCLVVFIAGCSIRAQTGAAFLQPQSPEAPAKPSVTPAPPKPPERPKTNASRTWWWQTDKHGDSYAIVSGDSLTMSGSMEDAERARRFRSKVLGGYVWFDHDGKQYLITDPATIKRAKELFRPQEEIGRKQAELGEKQARLGEEQARLGARQAGASVRMPALDDQVRTLRMELQTLEKRLRNQKLGELAGNDKLLAKLEDELRLARDKELTHEQLGELQAKAAEVQSRFSEDLASSLSELQSRMGELQSKFGELQSRVGEHQSRLGEEQSRLGEEQSRLGEQQSRLGEEQSRLAEEASRQLRRIFDECVRNGLAHQAE